MFSNFKIFRVTRHLVEVDTDIALCHLFGRMVEPDCQQTDLAGLFIKVIAECLSERMASNLEINSDLSRNLIDIVIRCLSVDRLLVALAVFPGCRSVGLFDAEKERYIDPPDNLSARAGSRPAPCAKAAGLFVLARLGFFQRQHLAPPHVGHLEPCEV